MDRDLERPAGKPDGWHVYHVCAGRIRRITRVTSGSARFTELTCTYCGEWCEVLVRSEADLLVDQGEARS